LTGRSANLAAVKFPHYEVHFRFFEVVFDSSLDLLRPRSAEIIAAFKNPKVTRPLQISNHSMSSRIVRLGLPVFSFWTTVSQNARNANDLCQKFE